jgi:hypothetical protein
MLLMPIKKGVDRTHTLSLKPEKIPKIIAFRDGAKMIKKDNLNGTHV